MYLYLNDMMQFCNQVSKMRARHAVEKKENDNIVVFPLNRKELTKDWNFREINF